ncbi:hypothetical protein ACOMHN_058834 [Nucella lapillus]
MAESMPVETDQMESTQSSENTDMENGASAQAAAPSASSGQKKPICVLVLGMAGSGKTTFVQRMTSHLHAKKTVPYVINLDPAVIGTPYHANIDVRDTVNYKEIMKQNITATAGWSIQQRPCSLTSITTAAGQSTHCPGTLAFITAATGWSTQRCPRTLALIIDIAAVS